MKFRVKNKLESPIKYNGILFNPQETKILDQKPDSDKFSIEEVEEEEKKKKTERRRK